MSLSCEMEFSSGIGFGGNCSLYETHDLSTVCDLLQNLLIIMTLLTRSLYLKYSCVRVFKPPFRCLFVQVIIPLMIWESTEFSRPVLAVVIVCSLALFPMFILPSGPSMWLSGMMFGYGFGFLIIMGGTTIGQSLPYFIGHWLLHDRVQVCSCALAITSLILMTVGPCILFSKL